LSFIEFAYNRIVFFTTKFSPFEIVYGCNPLTPLDLLSLHVDERVSFDGNKKAHVDKYLHIKVQQHIEKINEQHAFKTNKRRKKMVFDKEIEFQCI